MNKTNKTTFSLQHQQKVDELVTLAKEQGFITYEEINEILPMTFDSAEQIEPFGGRLEHQRTSRVQLAELHLRAGWI